MGAAALLAAAPVAGQGTDAVIFCLGSANLPMSAEFPPSGYELEIARAAAERMGVQPEFRWLGAVALDDFEPELRAGRCDAVAGVPASDTPLVGRRDDAPGVALTRPYYGAAYLLVRRAQTPPARTLADLRETRVAVEGESVATYTLRLRGQRVHLLEDGPAVIRAVADGRALYRYLWGPLAAWGLRDRSDVVLAAEFEPDEQWDFAFAVRDGDVRLRERLDDAIDEMARSGEIQRILAGSGIPYLGPRSAPTNSEMGK